MSPLIDLREHFSIWGRCGNTSFWKELGNPPYRHVFINPADGVMITAQDLMDRQGLAMNVWVHDGGSLPSEEIIAALDKTYPWVKRVLIDFFAGLMYTRVDLIKETPLSFFVKYYKDQTRKYIETGEGHSEETGKDEILEGVKRLIGSLEGKAQIVNKTILKADFDDFLEGYGILEC